LFFYSDKDAAITKASQRYESAISIFETSLGKAHSARAIAMNNYALLLLQAPSPAVRLFFKPVNGGRIR